MKFSKDLLFIGALDYPNIPQAGDTVKNQYLMDFFRKKFSKVDYIDTMDWHKHLLVLLQVFLRIIFGSYRNVVISVSNVSAYKIIKVISRFPLKKKVYYFMIGGYTPIKIKQGVYKAEPFRKLERIVVEADMVSEFYHEVGLDNTYRLYNFKPYSYIPNLTFPHEGKVKFVFLSRLTELKGIFSILQCVNTLNERRLKDEYIVDYYGKVDDEVKDRFFDEIKKYSNVSYKGFLNLKDENNYCILSDYDAMLFPTMHPTEGFPGVIADAAIAGLPVIAANWNYAEELIGDGVCGLLFPVGDDDALCEKMLFAIEHREQLEKMRKVCVEKARQYNLDNVLNEKMLNDLNLK